LFILVDQVSPLINQFVSNNFEKYKFYQGATTIGTGLGVIYSSILFILLMFFNRFQEEKAALAFKFAIISFIFIPLTLNVQMIGRMSMYFAPATIIAFPYLLKTFNKSIYRIAFIALLLLVTVYSYIQFFQSDIWKPYFGEYHTIFASPQIQ
jgi:hypothetical protein